VHVDIDGALDATAAGLRHATPVLHGIADQRIGGNGGDGLVPVLNLDRRQRDVDHVAVGAVLGHLDPVANRHHVVGGDLYTRHETENRVLEDQHQNRTQCADAAEKLPR